MRKNHSRKRENANFERPYKGKKLKKLFVIVCEGTKTEKNYFESIKKILKINELRIVPSPHSAPSSILSFAKRKFGQLNDGDEVYCVFDRDNHETFDTAIKDMIRAKMKPICSSPCFEYWILLHYEPRYDELDCKKAGDDIIEKGYIKDYSKDYDFTKILTESLLTIAIKNAEKSNKKNKDNKGYPYTRVVKLVKRLQGFATRQPSK